MRTYHIIVVAVVLVVGFGAKQFFFSPMKAKADVPSVSMNAARGHAVVGLDTKLHSQAPGIFVSEKSAKAESSAIKTNLIVGSDSSVSMYGLDPARTVDW